MTDQSEPLSIGADDSAKKREIAMWLTLMSSKQKAIFTILFSIWFMTLFWFWYWWLDHKHVTQFAGMLINSLLLVWNTLLPFYFFFFVFRMKTTHKHLDLPSHWRVAMVVTKAPSEPASMLQETLSAMLEQNVSHDTWLADEDPQPALSKWCEERGVFISSRKNVAAYHRPTWPRRKACKEGNLAYFYDHFGYDNYDFVIQMDADHIPRSGYLENMLRPFLDDTVGYVAAPSVCNRNQDESWLVRARLYAESTLHGCLQSGYQVSWAPLCIGSHYGVRTQALKEAGGLGPELAEDHSTSLKLNHAGWRGAFAFDAQAEGLGPSNFYDFLVQEFQWSASLTKILLSMTPSHLKKLPLRLKLQFLFAQLWYPLFSLTMLMSCLLPALALLFDFPWVNVSYLEFLARYGILSLATLVPIFWLRSQGWLRPQNAKILSWESFLFQFVRWPWVLLGVVKGGVCAFRNENVKFRVTPKNRQESALLSKVMIPYWLVAGMSALSIISSKSIMHAKGYYFLCFLNVVIYGAISLLIPWLHHKECRSEINRFPRMAFIGVFFICLTMVASGTELNQASAVLLDLGSEKVFVNKIESVKPNSNTKMTALQNHQRLLLGIYKGSGHHSEISIDHSFVTWRLDHTKELEHALVKAQKRGRIPMITLEPWPWNWQNMTSETLFDDILQGRYDQTLDNIFSTLARHSQTPILFRWAHEMEKVGQYPWAIDKPEKYISAYRYVYKKAQDLGFNHLLWVWSPVGNDTAHHYYPGDSYVDIIGVSLYASWAYDESLGFEKVRSFAELMEYRYWLPAYFKKPMLIAELGVAPDVEHRIAWLQDIWTNLERYPWLMGIVYFNQKQPDIVPFPVSQPDWTLSDALLRHWLTSPSATQHIEINATAIKPIGDK